MTDTSTVRVVYYSNSKLQRMEPNGFDFGPPQAIEDRRRDRRKLRFSGKLDSSLCGLDGLFSYQVPAGAKVVRLPSSLYRTGTYYRLLQLQLRTNSNKTTDARWIAD